MAIEGGYKCSKCGSFNISRDLGSGEYICHDCNSSDKAKTFQINDYGQQQQDKEEEQIMKMKMHGTDVNIKTKMPDVKDLNKDIANDFSKVGM